MSEVHEGLTEDIWMDVALLKHCQEEQAILTSKVEQQTERLQESRNPIIKLVAAVSRGVSSRRLENTNALVGHFTEKTAGFDERSFS